MRFLALVRFVTGCAFLCGILQAAPLSGNKITENGTYTVTTIPGNRYVFSAAGDFGSGTLAVQWVDASGNATAFDDSPATAAESWGFSAPGNTIALVLSDSSEADITVGVALAPGDIISNPDAAFDALGLGTAATADIAHRVIGTEEAGDTNTITLKSSPTLTIPLTVGTWNIEALIVVNAGAGFATAGTRQKLHFTGTGTFAGFYYSVEPGATTATLFPSNRQAAAINTEHLASGASSATLRIGSLVVTAPGNLVVQYAQRTATAAANPALAVSSYLKVFKQ